MKERYFRAFAGSALGTAVGDALGRRVEGWPHEAIKRRFGVLEEIEDGRYTDDTEMMIGLMEALVESPDFDPALASKRFLENFHPWRGYGARIYGVMERLRQGLPWDEVGTDSWGNGAAMRIAPIGFFYFDRGEELRKAAILSATITHKHPDGIAGALAQALTVAAATEKGLQGEPLREEDLLQRIASETKVLSPRMAEEILRIASLPKPKDTLEKASLIASSFPCDVSALGAVPAAIAAFLLASSFEEAVIVAVNAGGDTDTIGAMAGAVAGAYWGLEAIPQRWLERLEEGEKGRSYILRLAQRLAELRARE